MNKFSSNQKGAATFPLIVLFGVILAWLMAFLFITLYNQQLDLRVDDQAEALAGDLAQTAFTSLSGGQLMLDLPRDVGGSEYTIEVRENSIFVVEVIGGRRAGISYNAVVVATVTVENQDFSPGGRVYFMRSGDQIIVSAVLIEAPTENIVPVPSGEPPEFYDFAKTNPKAATAIIASYFFALENNPQVDVTEYKFEGDSVLVQIRQKDGGNLFGVSVSGYENEVDVGRVVRAWIVTDLSITDNLADTFTSSSVENAASGGWIYSHSQALEHLRGRTWLTTDNIVVSVPSLTPRAATATTIISAYPTWRVEWQSDNYYVIHFQAMPWWEQEDTAGFVFQSEPPLEPVV